MFPLATVAVIDILSPAAFALVVAALFVLYPTNVHPLYVVCVGAVTFTVALVLLSSVLLFYV